MSPREAASATGINRLTILRWIKSGRLAAERVKTRNGPGYEIRPEDLTQALDAFVRVGAALGIVEDRPVLL